MSFSRVHESSRFFVCPDCGQQFPVSRPDHSCSEGGQRLAAELIDQMLDNSGESPIKFESGIGLLWLYRIAYRINSYRNGLGRYRDRAEMARRVCALAKEFRK